MSGHVHLPRAGAHVLPLVAAALVLLPAPGWGSRRALAPLPIRFVANEGQSAAAVRFQASTLGGTIFFTESEVVLALPRPTPGRGAPGAVRELAVDARGAAAPAGVPLAVLRTRFVDASSHPELVGAERLPGLANFFRGSDPNRWRTRVPTYAAVVYRDLYPGIDLRYEGREGRIKASYLVSPGADPSRIRWRYRGVRSARLDDEGHLELALPSPTAAGAVAAPAAFVREERPVAWQDDEGGRRPVAVRYHVAGDGTVGFALPDGYDSTRSLVLDPTLTYSTYLGGGGEDVGYGIAVDATGTYVTGYTLSVDFPTQGPIDPGCGTDGNCDFGYHDVFVAKLDPASSGAASMVFSTYLGGSESDYGLRIAVDATGASYVAGIARSGFPTTSNAFQQTHTGAPAADAFLAKLSPDGSELLYSTYLGGSGGEGAWGLALDGANNVYLVGQSTSSNFPATVGALDTVCNTDGSTCAEGAADAFVAKLNPAASGAASLLFATYLGGSGDERGYGITRDASNQIYVTGRTNSTNFPLAGAPFQASNHGDYDAFLVKLNATGTALLYATYYGGGGYDDLYSVALGAANRAYVAGLTESSNLPTTASAFQPGFGGGLDDAYFAKFDPAAAGAASRLFASYLGGGDDDQGFGLAVDAADVAYVVGFARSTDFPTAGGAFQPASGGYWDAFLAKVDPALSGTDSLVYATHLGGLSTDAAFGVALDGSANIYVVGQTYSGDFPAVGAFQSGQGGSSDVFVARIDNALTSADLRVSQTASDPARVALPLTYTITVTNDGAATASGARLAEILLGSASYLSATPSQGTCSVTSYFMEIDLGCSLGALASGASATVTFAATPTADGLLTSTASVASNVSDPDGADNVATASTTAVDLVFSDDFETGDTSRWSATASDGDLTVTGAAAMAGTTRGLRALVNGTNSLHVEDRSPTDESHYRARFYFDPNGFDPGVAQNHLRTRVFLALADGPTRRLVAIVLRRLNGQYAIRARVRVDDGTRVDTPFVDITDAPHFIEFQWERSGGPGFDNGFFQLWIDDNFAASLFGLDTDAAGVDTGRLGALSVKPGASGTLFFDEFVSRRQNYIGP